ncbi:ARM repeat-containing protein [Neocallimastix lanati (nom. inval.)]|jgi:HEAT repeat protein|uniref:ARM repeat-containing protein n=1 Tax=Neocallimastix californiae TaxID=1754190 RepID=A0A1Y2FEF7_9FUNG|nr:ARM repeat-containing protein [Neocallimastix sp. JGI-2020a]ORY82292.1 ARM repeat-containing protein [Neocallimastix californiae]|eukprot:ORY82292.1 ARM repeat-containing protein [Neocallimastix californiae]
MLANHNGKHQQAVTALSSLNSDEQLKAVRFIKNSIIGNITKKKLYMDLNVSPILIKILTDDSYSNDMKIQSSVIIGSIANGNEQNILRLVDDGAIKPLLETFKTDDPRLYEASARALKALLESDKTPHDILFEEQYLKNIISHLKPCDSNLSGSIAMRNNPYRISEVTAQLISKISISTDEQNKIAHNEAIPLLLNLITSKYDFYPKIQEAALEALSCLCKENKDICLEVIDSPIDDESGSTIKTFLKLVHSKRPEMKLLAITCLTNIYRSNVSCTDLKKDILLIVLPALVKLLNIPDSNVLSQSIQTTNAQERAPMVFSYLIAEDKDLQKAAMEGDAITKLANIIKMTSSEDEEQNNYENYIPTNTNLHKERLRESSLFAIASICAYEEEYRKQVIEAKLLPIIVQSMSHPNFGIRMAACHCTKSLSRSVKTLRTSLVDSGVINPLLKLLSDPDIQVQNVACAALCNVVLDFSPMKKVVLDNGGVQRLVTLVHSMDSNLRLNAIWALKNIVFSAESQIKDKIMKELGWDQLYTLINDEELDIQEQAINLLRNLACSDEYDIEETIKGLGETRIIEIFESKLQWGIQNTNSNPKVDNIIIQTIWALVNIFAGNEKHKKLLMTDNILNCLLQFITHKNEIIRLAVIWCCLNLTNPDDIGTPERKKKLISLNFPSAFKMIINDPKIDVRNKVKEILKHFEDPSEMQIMESFISSPLNRRDDLSVNQSESELAEDDEDYFIDDE